MKLAVRQWPQFKMIKTWSYVVSEYINSLRHAEFHFKNICLDIKLDIKFISVGLPCMVTFVFD